MNYDVAIEIIEKHAIGTDWYLEFRMRANRLQENINSESRFGTNEGLRSERAQIVSSLDILILPKLGIPFSKIVTNPNILSELKPVARKPKVNAAVQLAVDDEYGVLDSTLRNIPGYSTNQHTLPDGSSALIVSIEHQAGTVNLLFTRQDEMGATSAISRVRDIHSQVDFDILAMCGVCAGRPKKTKQGDLVFAKKMWRYGPGKVTVSGNGDSSNANIARNVQSFALRPKSLASLAYDLDSSLKESDYEAAKHLLPASHSGLYRPSLMAGAMKMVPDVIVDPSAFSDVDAVDRSTIAIDMESYAFAEEADRLGLPSWFVVKGVQDHAMPAIGEVDKNNDYRMFAAAVAAIFTIRLVAKLSVSRH